jgi:K+-sensing histidine kinase KdpD
VSLAVEGNDQVLVDGDLMGQAVDALLLQSLTHSAGSAVQVGVNGQGRHAVLLQFSFSAVLDTQARGHLLGDGAASTGASQALGERGRLGLGLDLPQRLAHAHGGTLIGQSNERHGTLFEMMLPRATGHLPRP